MSANPQLLEKRPLEPVVATGHTFETITDKISSIVLNSEISLGWLALLVMAGGLAGVLLIAAT